MKTHPALSWKWLGALAVILTGFVAPAAPRQNPGIHDPSTILKAGSHYWLFATGPGIISRYSTDLQSWNPGPRVFPEPPAWTTNVVRGFRGHFWAPDVIHWRGRYLLYYSVSSWGSQVSGIGLASNPALDPEDPGYCWTDHGAVVKSDTTLDFNAIDPSVFPDGHGNLWLVFGSYWGGIKLVQLDPETGLRLDPEAAPIGLAWKEAIEAAALHRREDFYYLFLNWGRCCAGTNSTYNIRVGRSRAVTGPYLDRDGVDLLKGGGTLVLGTEGRFIGPGHAGFFRRGNEEFMSFHFYDGDRQGAKTLGIREVIWSGDGWPAVGGASVARQTE